MRPLWFFLLIFLCENVILWLIFVPLSTIQHSEPECVQIDSRQGCFAKVTNQTVLGELKMREKEGEKTSESLTERISLEKNVSSDKNVSLVAMVKVFRRFDCAAATVASLRAAGIDSVWLLCDGGAADTCPNGTALVTPFDVGALDSCHSSHRRSRRGTTTIGARRGRRGTLVGGGQRRRLSVDQVNGKVAAPPRQSTAGGCGGGGSLRGLWLVSRPLDFPPEFPPVELVAASLASRDAVH